MAINLIAFLSAVGFIYFAKNMIMPIVLSIFLYFLLDPIVNKLQRKYFPRGVISPLLMVVVVGLVSLLAWVTYLTTAEISSQLPAYDEKVKALISYLMEQAKIIEKNSMQLFPVAQEPVTKVEIVRSVGDITSNVLKGLDAVAGIAGSIFMVPILTLFFLIERNRIKEKLAALPLLAQSGDEIARKIARVVQGFFIGNLIAGVASTILFFAAFAFLGLDNNIALSIGAGFLNLVPIVGAFLAMLFPLAQALLQFTTITPFLVIAIYALVIHFLIGNLVLPKLMGSRVDLNVTAATIGMLFWGFLWGALGIFLAVPITACIKVILGFSEKTKKFEILLSESSRIPSTIILVNSLRAFTFRKTTHDGTGKAEP